VTAVIEDYVTESGTAAEVIDVEVELDHGMTKVDIVVASSQAAPSVDALAELPAGDLSAPVQVQLLVASTETERATIVPSCRTFARPEAPRPAGLSGPRG
jgi:hypothetical protein